MGKTKQVKLGTESRKKLLRGIDILSTAVVSTMGPNGRNIIIEGENGTPSSTKDGVTVAKDIYLQDEIENMGAQLVKQASTKTADKAGDGTTTSTLLASEMVKEGMKFLDLNENAVQIKRGMEKAVNEVVNYLRDLSQDISSEEQLEQIATISANNDVEIGKLITTALDKVGRDGIVHIEESKSGETYLETVEGIQFDKGYKSHFFVTNNDTMTCNLEDPYILIADHKFTQVKELLPILQNVSANNKSLLIIAEDIDNEALATLIVNKSRGSLNVAAVKAPEFGERRKLILEDIATLTGGKVFSKEKGMKLDKFSFDWFGEARKATISKENTTIIDGKGDENSIEERIDYIKNQINHSDSPFATEKLQERLAKMVGGVSIIHVGGLTETEMKERKDRVDDALQATKAAIEEGIIPGGGSALLYVRDKIKDNPDIGSKIIYNSCGKPFEQILINAGFTPSQAELKGYELKKENKKWEGYNLQTDTICNMKSEGIIDPTKVTRTALENAVSVAGTILLTEGVITKHPDEEDKEENMNPMGMF